MGREKHPFKRQHRSAWAPPSFNPPHPLLQTKRTSWSPGAQLMSSASNLLSGFHHKRLISHRMKEARKRTESIVCCIGRALETWFNLSGPYLQSLGKAPTQEAQDTQSIYKTLGQRQPSSPQLESTWIGDPVKPVPHMPPQQSGTREDKEAPWLFASHRSGRRHPTPGCHSPRASLAAKEAWFSSNPSCCTAPSQPPSGFCGQAFHTGGDFPGVAGLTHTPKPRI